MRGLAIANPIVEKRGDRVSCYLGTKELELSNLDHHLKRSMDCCPMPASLQDGLDITTKLIRMLSSDEPPNLSECWEVVVYEVGNNAAHYIQALRAILRAKTPFYEMNGADYSWMGYTASDPFIAGLLADPERVSVRVAPPLGAAMGCPVGWCTAAVGAALVWGGHCCGLPWWALMWALLPHPPAVEAADRLQHQRGCRCCVRLGAHLHVL